jgi:hypothetical protein
VIDAGGHRIGATVVTDDSSIVPVLLEERHKSPTVDPGRSGEAGLLIGWGLPCGQYALGSIVLELPSNGGALSVTFRKDVAGRCDVPTTGSSLFVSFEPSTFPAYPTPTPPPLILSARIDAPAAVSAGDTLRYTVTLTNESGATFRFGECPVYTEQFVKNIGRYYLDCESVGALAPGESATFEMRLVLDPRLTPPLADWELRWELEPQPNTATATATIRVDRNDAVSTPAPKPTP